jgi:MFS family permease
MQNRNTKSVGLKSRRQTIKTIVYEKMDLRNIAANKYGLLMGFVIVNGLTGVCAGIISLAVPLFAANIGASTREIGLINGIVGVGSLLMVLPSGILVDVFGAKKLYVVGSAGSIVTTLLLANASSTVILLLAMLLQGLSNALRFTALNTAFLNKLSVIGLEKSGWYRGSLSIGLTFIGPLVGGEIISMFAYEVVFRLTALLILVPVVPLMLLLFLEPNGTKGKFLKFKAANQLGEFKELLKDKILRQTVILEGISTACFSSFATFIVLYAVNTLHMGIQYASWLFLTEGIAYTSMVFLGGRLLYKYNRKQLYLISFTGMMLGLSVIAFCQITRILMFGTALFGMGIGLLNIVTYSNLGTICGKKGKISSVLSVCTGLGMSVGPMYGGYVGSAFSYSAIFGGYIPILLVASIYVYCSMAERKTILHNSN